MAIHSWTDLAPPPKGLGQGKKLNVSLSYLSVDRSWVVNPYNVLQEHGHAVFLDQVALVGGQKLMGTLRKNLRTSQAGILI